MTDPIKHRAAVPADLHGARLDQASAELFPDYSRSRLKTWIQEGKLTVDGVVLRPKDKVALDNQLELIAEAEAEVAWSGESLPLDICYEDDDVIVVNKPAGLVVHPAAGHPTGTLVNALLAHAPELQQQPRGGIVHRLDKDTSGVMFVAKSHRAHRSLVTQLSARSVTREYAALCSGQLVAGGTIDQPIGRHPTARTKMAVVSDGKPAITHFRVANRFEHFTQLQVNLETGRTHQIRVHMAWCRHPLVGDPVYGGRLRIPAGISDRLKSALADFQRQALHARSLGFDHPATGERMQFDANLPDDFRGLLAVLEAESPGVD
ncbi:ribosomal large subunit pseudouridine synthase D [Luminiphilus syltensis NOR5-1B]|uniref:Pseudouridine synthase n=1 Tax=Luminiphilus syltensis NOR5-1B TaxID=565045 RepID=B8KX21_9GAMM|nr:23S rRNA pseudouridine(1911/1915/1917) synthase RluD [Luminiphilus syltensis]EED35770.1 ribosomal large subunit pseudouridine synthase D [Luminiphilus syltensis NOR5-1B]